MVVHSNLEAKTTMGELNYLINEINEYWEQRNFVFSDFEERRKTGKSTDLITIICVFLFFYIGFNLITKQNFTIFKLVILISSLIGLIIMLPKYIENIKMSQKLIKMQRAIEKELDAFIKKEWNPRIKKLKDNSTNFASDKELREKYNSFINADKDIKRMTIAGQRNERLKEGFKQTAMIAGVTTVVVTGAVLGGMSSLNKRNDKQWFFDH